jgi:hypothetical protein
MQRGVVVPGGTGTPLLGPCKTPAFGSSRFSGPFDAFPTTDPATARSSSASSPRRPQTSEANLTPTQLRYPETALAGGPERSSISRCQTSGSEHDPSPPDNPRTPGGIVLPDRTVASRLRARFRLKRLSAGRESIGRAQDLELKSVQFFDESHSQSNFPSLATPLSPPPRAVFPRTPERISDVAWIEIYFCAVQGTFVFPDGTGTPLLGPCKTPEFGSSRFSLPFDAVPTTDTATARSSSPSSPPRPQTSGANLAPTHPFRHPETVSPGPERYGMSGRRGRLCRIHPRESEYPEDRSHMS